jgi:hypothetical protein
MAVITLAAVVLTFAATNATTFRVRPASLQRLVRLQRRGAGGAERSVRHPSRSGFGPTRGPGASRSFIAAIMAPSSRSVGARRYFWWNQSVSGCSNGGKPTAGNSRSGARAASPECSSGKASAFLLRSGDGEACGSSASAVAAGGALCGSLRRTSSSARKVASLSLWVGRLAIGRLLQARCLEQTAYGVRQLPGSLVAGASTLRSCRQYQRSVLGLAIDTDGISVPARLMAGTSPATRVAGQAGRDDGGEAQGKGGR